MKTKLFLSFTIILLLFVLGPNNIFPQGNDNNSNLLKEGNTLIYKGLVKYDENTVLNAKDKFAAVLKNDSLNAPALYGYTFSEYKLLELSMKNRDKKLFNTYYQKAIDDANKLITLKEYSSEGKSLLAAIYMMKIATDRMSAVALSPRINDLLDDAEYLNPKNPESYVIRGMMKFNTPAEFGGSYKDALENFNKAELLFNQKADLQIVNDKWGMLEAVTWAGRSNQKLNNNDAAKFAYQKVLSLEPNYNWVKYVLLPGLEKKSQKN